MKYQVNLGQGGNATAGAIRNAIRNFYKKLRKIPRLWKPQILIANFKPITQPMKPTNLRHGAHVAHRNFDISDFS